MNGMTWKLHVPYGLGIIALAVVAGVWYQKAVDARAALKASADSAAVAERQLNASAAAWLHRVRTDSGRQVQAEEAIRAKDAYIHAMGIAAAAAATRLAEQLTAEQQTVLDSITALNSSTLATVSAQRDSAIGLLHQAATERDSLTQLVIAYQGQLRVAVAKLERASRTPFLNSRPVRLVYMALAVKGAVDLWRGR